MLSSWTPAAKTYHGEIYRLVDPFRLVVGYAPKRVTAEYKA